MKRYLSVLIAVLMVAGLATAAGAALTYDGLTIDVDFWTGASDRLGPGDQGGTFNLNVGDEIGVDVYLSTAKNIGFLSYDMQFDPSLVQADRSEAAPQPAPLFWFAPTFDNSTPGSATFATGVIDPSTGPATVTGNDILFSTIIFKCTSVGPVDLILANYLGFDVGQPVTENIAIDPNGNLGTINQVVPIPGTIWLLGAGLAGLVGIRRNRRK